MSPSEEQRHKHLIYQKINNTPTIHDDGDEGEGPWIMSFADMVTLLMCFFILFFQTDEGNIKLKDPEKLKEQLAMMQKLLGVDARARADVSELALVRTPSSAEGAAETFGEELRMIARDLNIIFYVGVPHPGEMELTFLHSRLFKSGSTELTPLAERLLTKTAAKLRGLPPATSFEVEGYTDADPIGAKQYPSNWELSGARAAAVVRYLAKAGLPEESLSFRGFGQFRPMLPERDRNGKTVLDNKAANRRIVLRVRYPDAKQTKTQ